MADKHKGLIAAIARRWRWTAGVAGLVGSASQTASGSGGAAQVGSSPSEQLEAQGESLAADAQLVEPSQSGALLKESGSVQKQAEAEMAAGSPVVSAVPPPSAVGVVGADASARDRHALHERYPLVSRKGGDAGRTRLTATHSSISSSSNSLLSRRSAHHDHHRRRAIASSDSRGWCSRRFLARLLAVSTLAVLVFMCVKQFSQLRRQTVQGVRWLKGLGVVRGSIVLLVTNVVGALLFLPCFIFTLVAGYLYGLFAGTIIVSLASTLASALAFLIARYLAEGVVRSYISLPSQSPSVSRASSSRRLVSNAVPSAVDDDSDLDEYDSQSQSTSNDGRYRRMHFRNSADAQQRRSHALDESISADSGARSATSTPRIHVNIGTDGGDGTGVATSGGGSGINNSVDTSSAAGAGDDGSGEQRNVFNLMLIDNAIKHDGFWVILLIRLSPVHPYGPLNYLLGLTSIPFLDYIIASAVGMLPSIIMEVWFGAAVKDVSQLASDEVHSSPAQRVFFAVGIAVTVFVSVYVTWWVRDKLNRYDRSAAQPGTAIPMVPVSPSVSSSSSTSSVHAAGADASSLSKSKAADSQSGVVV